MKKTLLLILTLVINLSVHGQCPGGAPSGTELVTNGNFSAGNTGFSSSYSYNSPPNLTESTYWVAPASQVSTWNPGMTSKSAPGGGTGNIMMLNGSPGVGVSVWCETFAVAPNKTYLFSAWVTSLDLTNPAILQFSINGSLLSSPVKAPDTLYTWDSFNASWNSGTDTSATICIVDQNTLVAGNDFGLDDISFKACSCNLNIGTISASQDTICPSGNALILLSGGAGDTLQWQSSFTNGNFNNISGATGTNYDSYPLSQNTYFRVFANNNGCSDTSNSINIIVASNANTGTISANPDTICLGTIANLSVNGNSRGALQWQSSADSVGNFSTLTGATKVSYTSAPLNQSTYFRIIVDNGTCTDTSSSYKIIVISPPAATFIDSVNGREVRFKSTVSGAISYSWNFGDGSPLSSQLNPTHTYNADSTYDVCLTVRNNSNCNFTVCQNVTTFPTDINNVMAPSGWQVYPDPFHSQITLASNQGRMNIETIEIYDVLGRTVFIRSANNITGNVMVLDVSDLTEGVYYLVIKTGNGNYIQPLIKQ